MSFIAEVVPNWLGALGTAGALGWVIWEKTVIQRRESATSQAKQVATWVEGGWVFVRNNSDLPIYDVVVSFLLIRGAGPRKGEELVSKRPLPAAEEGRRHVARTIFPPGIRKIEYPLGSGGMNRLPGSEVAFTDASGKHWVRRVDGKLEKLLKPPLIAMNVSQPFVDF